MGTIHENQFTFIIISRSVLLRMKNISDEFVEKIKTNFTFSKFFFDKSFHLWDSVEKYGIAREAKDGTRAHAHCMLDA